MKKFLFIVLCITAVLMSCNNEDQQQTIFGDGFAISIDTDETLEFLPVGEKKEFSLTTGKPLTIKLTEKWIDIYVGDKKFGDTQETMDIEPGYYKITLYASCAPSLDPNEMSKGTYYGDMYRKGVIQICKNSNHTVAMLNLKQQYPYLYFDKVGCSTEYKWTWADKYDVEGCSVSYEIKSNIKWKATIDESSSQTINFIELSKENKDVDVDLNMITRTTVLLGENWEANVAAGENNQTFSIAPCNYNLTSDPHQCKITVSDITESTVITPLTINCSQTNLKFIVSQKDSNGKDQEIENKGELLEPVEPWLPSSKEIKVVSEGGLSWVFSFEKDWVSLKDNNGNDVEGDQVDAEKTYTLYAHIDTNDSRKDRDSYGTFTITANGATATRKFKLTQAAFEHDVVDENSNTVKTVSFSNMGEVQLSNDQKIYMSSSGRWERSIGYKTDTNGWLAVDPESADVAGQTEINLSVANQNPELKSRTAVVTFNSKENNLQSELTIEQDPFIFELGGNSTTQPDVLEKDDTTPKTITLKTSGEWIATANKKWLTIDPNGDKNENGVSINYSAATNTGADERQATITLKSVYHENNGFSELYNPIEVEIRQLGSFVVDKVNKTLYFGAFDNLSNEVNVKCLATNGWTATSPTWLTVSPNSSTADDIDVTFTASKNTSFEPRNGQVEFKMWDEGEQTEKSRIVNVEQAAYVFEVTDENGFNGKKDIPAYNTNEYVCYAMNISCTGVWGATVSPTGAAVLSQTDNYDTSLTHSIANCEGDRLYVFVKNNNNDSRNITVTITCDGDSTGGKNTKTLIATQLKYDFSVNTTKIENIDAEVESGNITRTFKITCSGEWTIDRGSYNWFSFDYSNGTIAKDKVITMYIDPNNTKSTRIGTITIRSVDLNKSCLITVSQQSVSFDDFAENHKKLQFDAMPKAIQEIDINCTGSWKYDKNNSEIEVTVTPESGFGAQPVKILPSPNYNFEDITNKKLYFINELTGQSRYLRISMSGYVLTVPDTVTFGKDTAEQTIQIECSGTWKVKSVSEAWIEKCEKSADDPTMLVIKVSKNDTGKDREGTIYIWAENNENLIREIKVKQTK